MFYCRFSYILSMNGLFVCLEFFTYAEGWNLKELINAMIFPFV